MKFDGKKYVQPAAVAHRWGCSKSTVLKYAKNGLISGAFKCNGYWYIPSDATMPEFNLPRPGVKPGNAKSRDYDTSSHYDIWLNDIERHESWSKLFLEV